MERLLMDIEWEPHYGSRMFLGQFSMSVMTGKAEDATTVTGTRRNRGAVILL